MKKLTLIVFTCCLLAGLDAGAQVSIGERQVTSEAKSVHIRARAVRIQNAAVGMARVTPPTPPTPSVAVSAAAAAQVEPPQPPQPPDQAEATDDPVSRKVFSRSFPVDRSNRVVLSNQFGDVQIKSWDKMEVRTEVEVTAYASRTDEARRLLEQVNIEASQGNGAVSCRTTISGSQGNWGSWFSRGKKTRREVRVNYVVYMPTVNALQVNNEYGNIEMGNFSGPLNARVQYGNFNATNLTNALVSVSTQYGKTTINALNRATIKQEYGAGVVIGTANGLNLHAQYAKVNIGTITNDAQIRQEYGEGLVLGTVGSLVLNAQYIKVNIREIRNAAASIRLDYATLQLGSVQSLTLDADYTDVNIGTLRGDGRFSISYNRLNVGQVSGRTRSIVVNGEYADIAFGFASDFNADFDVQTSYSGLRYTGNDRISARTLTDDDHTSRRYQGKIGRGGGLIKVNSTYGGVTFR